MAAVRDSRCSTLKTKSHIQSPRHWGVHKGAAVGRGVGEVGVGGGVHLVEPGNRTDTTIKAISIRINTGLVGTREGWGGGWVGG